MECYRKGNDKLLVKELKKGSRRAFRKLFELYRNDLYKFCLALVCRPVYAEEIVQEVFLKIWMKRESLDSEMSFKSYIFTITRNKSIKFLKKAANYNRLREEVFYNSQKSNFTIDNYIRESELEALKQAAMDKLTPKRRLVFEMSRNEGKSYDKIADELGISRNTVRNLMSQALGTLREVLIENKEISLLFCLFLT